MTIKNVLLLIIGLGTSAETIAQGTYPYLNNYSGTTLHNYVRTYTLEQPEANSSSITLTATSDKKITSTTYYDGLGRPLQDVQKNAIPAGAYPDLIKVHTYDSIGKESFSYPPYSVLDVAASGKLKTNPFTQLTTQYNSLYPAESPYFYNEIVDDHSPLDRVTKSMGAGQNWIGSGHGVQTSYYSSAPNTVILWKVGSGTPGLINSGYYAPNSLYITSTIDEDGHVNNEFKDKLGNIVLKTQFTGITGWFVFHYTYTYYVYDDLNHLRYVITPEAINQGIATASGATLTSLINGLCYSYTYDERGRVIIKQIPGKTPESMVYDRKDRLVLTQDGMLKNGETNSYDVPTTGNTWRFTYYDVLDRPLMKGLYINTSTPSAVQTAVTAGSGTASSLMYYLSHDQFNNYPTVLSDIVDQANAVYYYDDYMGLLASIYGILYTASYNSQFTGIAPMTPPAPTSASQQNRGLLTGSYISVGYPAIGTMSTTMPHLKKLNFYDTKGRLIQTNSQNFRTGTDIVATQYDYAGNLVSSVAQNNNPNAADIPPASTGYFITTTTVKNYAIDYANGKPTGLTQKINDGLFVPVNSLSYDALARVSDRKQNVADNNYTYNIRGWLTGINSAYLNNTSATNIFFCEELLYNDVTPYNSFGSSIHGIHGPSSIPFGSHALLNGNIAGILWKGYLSSPVRSYAYTYDVLQRVITASFAQSEFTVFSSSGSGLHPIWENTDVDYTMSNVSYDLNGNIKTLNHRGPNPGGSGPVNMDILTYAYQPMSNRLLGVKDDGVIVSADPDFKDDASHSLGDYTYDANGNLTSDNNKNITSISYSHINKPEHIVVSGKGTIDFTYDAEGNKLQKIVVAGGTETITDYLGPFQYQDNVLQNISHEEGRCRPSIVPVTGTVSYVYDYFIKDHLDNVRSVATAQAYTVSAEGGATSAGTVQAYMATHELPLATPEEALFENIPPVRNSKPATTDSSDVKTATLIGSDSSKRIVNSLLLRVMPGAQFSIRAESYHESATDTAVASNSNVVSSLLGVLGGGYGAIASSDAGNTQIFNNAFSDPSFPGIYHDLVNASYDPLKPKAFISYIVLDENMKVVPGQSGVLQVSGITNNWSLMGTASNIQIKQPGYLMAFMSSSSSSTVSIDNFVVTLYSGNELEEDHYYPFGLNLEIAGVSPTQVNNIKYNSKELQRNEFTDATTGMKSGLTWEDYGARMQDPQIGRWNGIDEKAEDYENFSPYVYGANNPVKYLDKDGKDIKDMVWGFTLALVDNTLSTHLSQSFVPNNPTAAKDFNDGQANGNVSSFVAGVIMTDVGKDITESSIATTIFTGGASSEVTVPTAVIGASAMVVGGNMMLNSLRNVTAPKANNGEAPPSQTVKREATSKSREKWEKANNKEWPKEPDNPEKNQTVSHKKALKDGGTNEVENIEPKPAKEHHDTHKNNGDYSRWRREAYKAKQDK